MALASLRFQRNAQDYEESRQGMTVFAGDAASFHEWQFRLQIKKSLCTADELLALTAKVVDASRGEAVSCAMEIRLAKLMEANGLDLLVQKVQERLFPQRTAEARELLKQGMRNGGPVSRVPGEPMTSYISRRRRWWTLVHEMDNTLELGDTVQGSVMLEQAGLSRFEQNMVLTYTKGQRTMTAIAEALLEQYYDVHHRGRETPTPTGNSSPPNRWRRRDTTRAYLAEAEPIKELTDTAAYGEEGISDDYDGEQDEAEDDEIHEMDLAALLSNSGEDPEADDALADALQLDAVAMVAWQRFNGKGKSKGKGKIKGKGKGKYKGNNLSLEERRKRLAELKSRTNCQACGARGHWAGDDVCPKNAKNESTLQSPARAYLTIGGETSCFDLALSGDEMSLDATALVAHARLDASDIPVETHPKAPPGTRRPRKPPRVIPSPPPPTPQCAGSRRCTNATVERFTCVDCGFVTTRCKGATEDPAMCPHVETDTRGSSKTLVRHTCKVCLKIILELPRNEATVRESTAKDVSRADTSQFRDISRAMHVRPQITLNAREVDLVLGLLTRNVHVHLSRLSSISGTDFVSLLDDAIESILDPTETVTARNTGTTITTNDTSSGATSSLSASQSGAATQSKAFCSHNTELQNVFVPQPPQLLAVQTLVMAVDADGNEIGQRCDQSLDSPFDLCQGQPDSPSVSLQDQQVTSSDSLRGQTAMPRVPAQQIDSDDEETAFFAAESFVMDQEHDERIWATLDEGCNAACHSASWAARAERYFEMFGFQSEYHEGTRNMVFTKLGGNTVAAVGRRKFPFALAFTAERGDIHHLSGTVELFPIDAQAKLGLTKDMARSRIFIENKPGFYLRMYKDAKTGLMLINVADFDLLNDQALTPQLYALAATIPPPTCLTGGTNASGELVDILRSLTRLPGNHTLRFTHVATRLDVMDEYPGTDGLFRRYINERHCGRIRDFSLGD